MTISIRNYVHLQKKKKTLTGTSFTRFHNNKDFFYYESKRIVK